MNNGKDLLLEVSQKYNICKGEREPENEWKTRVIYSICGMMAYASLWDLEETVSLVHLKGRIRNILSGYQSIYPESVSCFPLNSKELEDEVSEQFLKAGIVYHRPNRVSPSVKHEGQFKGIVFQRGIAIDRISCVSGIGFYAKGNGETDPKGVKTMFGLEQDHLSEVWRKTLSNAVWVRSEVLESRVEYLRSKPPYRNGYWESKPDTTGSVSMLRTGEKGSYLYYLYRFIDKTLEISPLSGWKVEDYQYRSLSCACLAALGTLPPIEYVTDGKLVHLRLNYLLPPPEMWFLKLYSWPEACRVLPCDFRRKLSSEVFEVIKEILSSKGYVLKEGMK